jgi:hypothetical protein
MRQGQCYHLNTNSRTGCWRSSTRTTETEMSLFGDLKFLFFIVLCIFSIFLKLFFLLKLLLLFFFPLVRQWQSYYSNTNTRTGCWRSNTRTIKTETLLHLNLGLFFLFFFSLLFSFFSFFLNAYLLHCWLVHYLSLLVSSVLKFFSLFFSFCALFFLLLFHSRYHYLYYYKLDYTKLHTLQGQ